MKKKKDARKLNLHRETLRDLEDRKFGHGFGAVELKQVVGQRPNPTFTSCLEC